MSSLLDNSLQVISKNSNSSLFVRLWPCNGRSKGLVYIVHGFASHCILYEKIALKLNSEGFSVAGHDHYGHGMSEGTKVHIANYKTYVEDTVQCLAAVREQWGTQPTVLFGHSLGGLVVNSVASSYPDLCQAVVLQAPAYKLYSALAGNVAWYLSYVLPYLYIPYTACDPEALVADEAECKEYINDPWIWQSGPRLSHVHALMSGQAEIKACRRPLPHPTLIQYGGSDTLCDVDAIIMMADKGQSVQLKEYEGARHYLHLDRIGIQLQVLEDLVEFCHAQL